MNTNRRIPQVIILTCIFALLSSACGAPKPSQTNTIASQAPATSASVGASSDEETRVEIDGKGGDWLKYEVIGNDAVDDQEVGTPDMGEVRAFNNDQYFYLMLRIHKDGLTDHYDVLMDVNGGEFDFQASVWPETDTFRFQKFPVSSGMDVIAGGQVAKGEVIELKLPLTWLNGQQVKMFMVQTFMGNKIGDMTEVLSPLVAQEKEVIGVPANKPPSTQQGQSAGGLCQGERQLFERTYFTITLNGAQNRAGQGAWAEMLWQTAFVPWWVRVGPDGKVYAVSESSDAIYELKADGTLAEVFVCPGVHMESAVMASDGAFWFATQDNGRLVRVDKDGTIKLVAQSGNRNLEAGLDGSVYTFENGLERIDPDGTRTMIAKDVYGRKFAIGPQGEIVVLTGGKVQQINADGSRRELGANYGPEPWLVFGPDGKLYVTHWSGVDVIDLEKGNVAPIDWLENRVPGEAGAFTADGRLLVYHPNTNVFAIDLQKKTIAVYYQTISNSWALGVSPDGKVYVAFGNKIPDGETTIYRVVDMQTLEPVLSVPYGNERSMAFGLDGTGYIAVSDEKNGVMVYSFDPASGNYQQYYQPKCWVETMATNPVDGRVWIGDCGNYISLDENQRKETIKGVPKGENTSLAITTAGEFYAMVFFPRSNPDDPSEHAIYHLKSNGGWEKVTDDTQSDPGITMAKMTGCVDGKVYTVESLGPENLPTGQSSYNAVRQLEADGSLTLVGFDFAFDGQDAGCDYVNRRVIFTSGVGIWAVTLP